MPLPKQMQHSLELDLRNHGARLKDLRSSIATLQAEVAVHEMLMTLGKNKAVRDTLDALYDHPELARKMAQNPTAFLNSRGIVMPEGTSVAVIDSDPRSTTVEVRFVQG